MDQRTTEVLRERLSGEHGELLRQLKDLGAQHDADGIEDPLLEAGFADAGQATAERVNLLTMVKNLRDTLREVEAALERMETGTYGQCQRSGQRDRRGTGDGGTEPGAASGRRAARARKVAVVVCDSLGVGAAPDAADYGDAGANTIGHTAAAVGGLRLPNLGAWGLCRLTEIAGVPAAEPAAGVVARMAE